MNDINMANRQCCDLDIRDYKTKAPWMFADFCNTTTMGFSSESTYANKKGQKCIKFDNPLDGTIAMTFQVHPFKVYAMLSDGEIETSAVIARKETITAAADGSITVSNTPVAGTLYVYAEDDFGGTAIEGTLSGSTFTADSIKTDSVYTVAYLEEKTSGVQKVSFNNKKIPKNFYIQMSTLDKNENGELVPVKITAYKASPQRNLELSFSSDGDPAEITITCDALVDDDGNVLDMIELTGESN
ncbi:hypothetical protein D7X88_15155 [bacterium C-53]|nr:hypothetical protein [Lachnospiraceae bacterium]NBI02203.1 hypothetical protein [Lachnospiraceae bacterium]RKJ08399.1 hypothetical protein D7X88_15155 [bacterium C-53]